jgi:alpha-1,6-mannosyltransferase
VANFVMPRSGGLRTALRALGEGYAAAGYEPILVQPGVMASDVPTEQGRVITLPGTVAPFTGGYRVLLGRKRLTELLDGLAPDRIEVSDRFTLRWTGKWAADRGVRSVMISHENLTGLLTAVVGLPAGIARTAADRFNARTAKAFDTVVCTSKWAANEFRRIGITNLVETPLGVDLGLFNPVRYGDEVRARYAAGHEVLLVHCGRLSPEKRPDRALDALIQLRAQGVDATLVMAGDGPWRDRLMERAAGHPVQFIEFVTDRVAVAELLAAADVVLAPGPIETFGLAALEALACGTPTVVDEASALPEVVGPAGASVPADDFASGVLAVLARPAAQRRLEARARAECFGWPDAVAGFLRAHGIGTERPVALPAVGSGV